MRAFSGTIQVLHQAPADFGLAPEAVALTERLQRGIRSSGQFTTTDLYAQERQGL